MKFNKRNFDKAIDLLLTYEGKSRIIDEALELGLIPKEERKKYKEMMAYFYEKSDEFFFTLAALEYEEIGKHEKAVENYLNDTGIASQESSANRAAEILRKNGYPEKARKCKQIGKLKKKMNRINSKINEIKKSVVENQTTLFECEKGDNVFEGYSEAAKLCEKKGDYERAVKILSRAYDLRGAGKVLERVGEKRGGLFSDAFAFYEKNKLLKDALKLAKKTRNKEMELAYRVASEIHEEWFNLERAKFNEEFDEMREALYLAELSAALS